MSAPYSVAGVVAWVCGVCGYENYNPTLIKCNGCQHPREDPATTEARALVDLYDQRIKLTREMAAHPRPTGAMAQAVLDKGAELDAACEAFRLKHYPRRHRIVSAGRQVFAVSRTARSIVTVYQADEEQGAVI